jgi:hypothetical protein
VSLTSTSGFAAVERTQPGRQELLHQEGGGPDAQDSAERAGPERVHGDAQRLEGRARRRRNSARPCGVSTMRSLAASPEQSHLELGLQPPDLLVNSRLGDGVREGTDRAGVPPVRATQ